MSEKPSFLVDQNFLRAHFAQKNLPPRALATYQGPLVEQIVVDANAIASHDIADLVQANVDFVNHMLNRGAYLPGEYPIEALWSYSVDTYVAEVLRGGHWSFIKSAGQATAENLTVAGCASGLKAFGGEPYFEVFGGLHDSLHAAGRRRTADTEGKLTSKIMEWVDIRVREADEKFRALNSANPLRALNGAWLKSLPNLRGVELKRLDLELAALEARNPLRSARLEEHRLAQDQREAANPMHRTMKELCRSAGLSFAGVTAGTPAMTPAAPGKKQHPAFWWGVRTDRGVYYVFFFDRGTLFKRYRAALHPKGGVQPIATLTLSAAEFASIVPQELRRSS